jgi:predicted N-acetyltransferase YhbS
MDTILHRPLAGETDWQRVRDLLIETFPITGPGFNWDFRRWDGHRFHRVNTTITAEWCKSMHLWETAAGRLVGLVHPDGVGEACLELQPDFRFLEEGMFTWAEENILAPGGEPSQRRLETYAFEHDAPRLLAKHGFEKTTDHGCLRRMFFGNDALPLVQMDPGYVLSTTRPGDEGEYQRMADMLNAGFNRTLHKALEYRNFVHQSPAFRHDLNLVAEAPDGIFAAHVAVNYDEVNRWGIFEPVCTHPAHRRHGLASSLMYEGMHRLKALGARGASVDTGDAVPANALYEAVGFTDAYVGFVWRKVFSLQSSVVS